MQTENRTARTKITDIPIMTFLFIQAVDAAIRIARVLNVSVEYLVTGQEAKTGKFPEGQDHELRLFLHSIKNLNTKDRKIILKNAKNLAEILTKINGK